jgi:hypothetical protein
MFDEGLASAIDLLVSAVVLVPGLLFIKPDELNLLNVAFPLTITNHESHPLWPLPHNCTVSALLLEAPGFTGYTELLVRLLTILESAGLRRLATVPVRAGRASRWYQSYCRFVPGERAHVVGKGLVTGLFQVAIGVRRHEEAEVMRQVTSLT